MLYTRRAMADIAPKPEPGSASRGIFDVCEWLTGLTGVDGWEISHSGSRNGDEFVTSYEGADNAIAEVTMRGLPIAQSASWELVSDVNGRRERILIPGRTRIKW